MKKTEQRQHINDMKIQSDNKAICINEVNDLIQKRWERCKECSYLVNMYMTYGKSYPGCSHKSRLGTWIGAIDKCPKKEGANGMKQGECWCNEKRPVGILWDQSKELVYALDGPNAMLRVRISKEQGRIGIPIDFCPYCGRRLADESPRCPEKEA